MGVVRHPEISAICISTATPKRMQHTRMAPEKSTKSIALDGGDSDVQVDATAAWSMYL